MNKLKPAVSHSNLKFAPRWSFTGQIISNVLSCSRTGFLWLQNIPYIQIISKSQITFPHLVLPNPISSQCCFCPVIEKMLKLSRSFYTHLPEIVTLPLRHGGSEADQRVLPQVHGGRRRQDPFKIRTTFTTGLSFIPTSYWEAEAAQGRSSLLFWSLGHGGLSFQTFFPSFFIGVT